MQAIRQNMLVQYDSILEVHSSLLKPGARVEVIVLLKEIPEEKKRAFSALLGAGKSCFSSAKEADTFIRTDRDSWK